MKSRQSTDTEAIAEYVADYVVADLRNGAISSDDLFRAMNKPPFVDALRGRIGAADVEWVKRMAVSDREPEMALGISLTHDVQRQPDVRRFLFDLWATDQSYHCRWWVMFRLVGYADLPLDWHRAAFEFAQENWDRWLPDVVDYFGGPRELVGVLNARRRNSSWPESTTWVRVLSAAGTDDPAAMVSFFDWIKSDRPNAPLVPEAIAFASEKRPASPSSANAV